jgi:hypothetical protein
MVFVGPMTRSFYHVFRIVVSCTLCARHGIRYMTTNKEYVDKVRSMMWRFLAR